MLAESQRLAVLGSRVSNNSGADKGEGTGCGESVHRSAVKVLLLTPCVFPELGFLQNNFPVIEAIREFNEPFRYLWEFYLLGNFQFA